MSGVGDEQSLTVKCVATHACGTRLIGAGGGQPVGNGRFCCGGTSRYGRRRKENLPRGTHSGRLTCDAIASEWVVPIEIHLEIAVTRLPSHIEWGEQRGGVTSVTSTLTGERGRPDAAGSACDTVTLGRVRVVVALTATREPTSVTTHSRAGVDEVAAVCVVAWDTTGGVTGITPVTITRCGNLTENRFRWIAVGHSLRA